MALLLTESNLTAVAVQDCAGSVTYGQLAADEFGLRGHVAAGEIVALRAHAARTVAAAVLALDGWASRVDLLGRLTADDLADNAAQIDDSATAAPRRTGGRPDEGRAEGLPTRWRLFTSGTTGAPKPVDHSLESLTRTVQRPRGTSTSGRRWGLLYEPTRMAGIQVVLQSLTGGDVLLDATGFEHLTDRLHWLANQSVSALSATPTLWRQVLSSADSASLPLTQITLGGEIADQGLLSALAKAFPRARITHVFASTETGAAFAVNDGREGFPRTYLLDPPKGIRLEVRDGVLFVEAPHTSAAGPDGFASTGDLVEVSDDRVVFLGRASGVINVGGVKVAPEQVETVLRTHPEVADAVVVPKKNPFSGYILVANVVAAPGAHEADLPARLRAEVAARLSSAHAPASIKIVTQLSTTATGKAGR